MPQPPVFYPLNYTPGQFIQSVAPAEITSGATATMTAALPNPVGPGNLLVASVMTHSTTAIATLTDSLFQTWQPVIIAGSSAYVNATAVETVQLFYIPQSRGGLIQVTATLNPTSNFVSLGICEYFGGGLFLGATGAQGLVTTGNAQTLVSFMPPSVTPAFSGNGVMLVGAFDAASAVTGAVAGMTSRLTMASGSRFMIDSNGVLAPSAAAAQNVGMADSGTSVAYEMIGAAFYLPVLSGIPF